MSAPKTPDLTIAYAPECRSGTTLSRLVSGAELPVVTAGGVPGWSTRPEDAAAFGARTLFRQQPCQLAIHRQRFLSLSELVECTREELECQRVSRV